MNHTNISLTERKTAHTETTSQHLSSHAGAQLATRPWRTLQLTLDSGVTAHKPLTSVCMFVYTLMCTLHLPAVNHMPCGSSLPLGHKLYNTLLSEPGTLVHTFYYSIWKAEASLVSRVSYVERLCLKKNFDCTSSFMGVACVPSAHVDVRGQLMRAGLLL